MTGWLWRPWGVGDRDLAVEVSWDETGQSGSESDLSSDSQESAADSGPEPATGDCLMCSHTKEVTVNSTHKKFWKKVGASCNSAKGCLWAEDQLKQIDNGHHVVWDSNYEVIKTEQELATVWAQGASASLMVRTQRAFTVFMDLVTLDPLRQRAILNSEISFLLWASMVDLIANRHPKALLASL